MASITVTVTSTGARPPYCTVVITNCESRYVKTIRQEVNGAVPAQFIDVPPGTYYIVVVPEGEDGSHFRFRRITGPADNASVTVDLNAINPVGKITAIVLVGGQRMPVDIVTIEECTQNGYYECCMTDINGAAVFQDVPNGQYKVTAYHGAAHDDDVCDLTNGGTCTKQFSL